MGDRQLFPPTIVSRALKMTGGYPLLLVGKATFRNRPISAKPLKKRDPGSSPGWRGWECDLVAHDRSVRRGL